MKNNILELSITGTLVIINGAMRTAPIEAEIRVFKNDRLINMTIANMFGDFVVRLPKSSGAYMLEFVGEDFNPLKKEIIAGAGNQHLNVIELSNTP
ncbi:MAG: hypothetical protein FWC75_09185 [Oscillospiraceae bacterium]|nr:hypothetical protein [Oscillospiraceae bacterium]